MDFKQRYQYNPSNDLLGRGGFARVYRATDTLLDRTVALKFFINPQGDKQHTLIKEISKAIQLEHPNLCRYYDAALLESINFHGEKDVTEVGVIEYLDGGDLKTYLHRNPAYLIPLLRDVLQGLSFLHKNNIVHRDLKTQNILIKNSAEGPVAKITDFGISKVLDASSTSSSVLIGTIEYMAPEQFNPEKYGINGKISTNVDLWSFGVMVYELVTGNSLFGQSGGQTSAEQIMSRILKDGHTEAINQLPDPYRQVVQQCLVTDASKRIQRAEQLIPFLSDNTAKATNNYSEEAVTMVLEKPSPVVNDADYESVEDYRSCTFDMIPKLLLSSEKGCMFLWMNDELIRYTYSNNPTHENQLILAINPFLGYKQYEKIKQLMRSLKSWKLFRTMQIEAAVATALKNTEAEATYYYSFSYAGNKRNIMAFVSENVIEFLQPDSDEKDVMFLSERTIDSWGRIALKGLEKHLNFLNGMQESNPLTLQFLGFDLLLNQNLFLSAYTTIPTLKSEWLFMDITQQPRPIDLSVSSNGLQEKIFTYPSENWQRLSYTDAIRKSRLFYIYNGHDQSLISTPLSFDAVSDDETYYQFKSLGESYVPSEWLRIVDLKGDVIEKKEAVWAVCINVDINEKIMVRG